MKKSSPKRESVRKANRGASRPEDPDTQRQRRAARLLRADQLPMGGPMLTRDDDLGEDSETEAALKRAVERDREA